MDASIEELKEKILNYFKLVSEDNYWDSYDDFQELIISYKSSTISKDEIVRFLISVRNEISTEWEDELVSEVLNRLSGYCSEFKKIEWD